MLQILRRERKWQCPATRKLIQHLDFQGFEGMNVQEKIQ